MDKMNSFLSPERYKAIGDMIDEAHEDNAKFDIDNDHRIVERADAIARVASVLHDEWRKTRLLDDGSYEPRVKSTGDEEWISRHGTSEVDIANTGFADLPSDWQKENHDAAEVIYDLRRANGGRLDLSDEGTFKRVVGAIHKAWLQRDNNNYALDGELDIPFEYLTREEMMKDVRQAQIGNQVLKDLILVEDGYKVRRRSAAEGGRVDRAA